MTGPTHSEEYELLTIPRRVGRHCQYGVFSAVCGRPATTKRPRPAGGQTWDLCDHHASFLDRIRTRIKEDKTILDRLENSR